MSFSWESVLLHAKSHLVDQVGSGSPVTKVSEFNVDSVRDSVTGSWLSSLFRPPSSLFVTIGELLARRTAVHSHSENAQCLGEKSSLDQTDHLGLKPLRNEKVFLLAWLKTGHGLRSQGETGDHGCVAMPTDDELYLKDQTGFVQCQASFCDWRWLDQALLIPCWNFIPGADARVRSTVEICPRCNPVVVSSVQSGPPLESRLQSVSIERAQKILHCHDSSRHTINDVQVTGIVVRKSPIITVRSNSLFFFELASDVSGRLSIPILATEKNKLTFLHKALPMYASCSVTPLRPTTMLKGVKQPYHVFLCQKDTTVTVVKHSCDDRKHRNSITGTVSNCIDASSGIYELDGKYRLYLCYQKNDVGPSTAEFRLGCVVTVHNAHLHRKTLPEMTRIVCCVRSTVHIDRFSPLDSGPNKKLSPSPSGMVRVLLQKSLLLSDLDWLSDVMTHLEKKFSPTYLRKKALHSLLWRLFIIPSTESKKPLLRGKPRNIYEEFVNPSHSCHASREVEKSPPWQFPDLAEVSKLGHDQEERVVDVDVASSLHIQETESKDMKPPRILLGYLHLNPTTGQVQLQDQTGCVDCIVTDTTPNGHTNKPTAPCHPPVVTTSNLGKSVERRCSFTCSHMHTWCLRHLVRVESFSIRSSPLTLARSSLGTDETCVSERVCSSGRVTEHRRSYVVFSMRSVECLNCEPAASATTARALHGNNGTHNRTETSHSHDTATCSHQAADLHISNLSSDKTASTDEGPKVANNLQISDCPGYSFLLLRKSQLLTNPEGSLFFLAHVLPVEDLMLAKQVSETLLSFRNSDFPLGIGAMRFDGQSVKWYNTLHYGSAYRVTGETTKIAKDDLLYGTSLSLKELMLAGCDDLRSFSDDAILQQYQENLLPPGGVDRLERSRSRFRNFLRVDSVSEVLNEKRVTSYRPVSFRGRIISRLESEEDEESHHDKKRKTSHHQSETQSSGNSIKFVVAHHEDTSSTLDIHVTKSVTENALGLRPGAYVTFRNCRQSATPAGTVPCCVYPWTIVIVECIPNDVKSLSLQSASARDESKFSDLSQSTVFARDESKLLDLSQSTVSARDESKSSDLSQSSVSPRDESKSSDLSQSSVSATVVKQCYITQLLATPDLVSPSQLVLINCHIQTVKHVSLKWCCRRCGHKDCVCSSDSGGQIGGIIASMRFIVEDSSGEAIVWCSVNSAIATLLGLTETRWSMLEQSVRQCQEVVYSYTPQDYNKVVERPESASDTEGWLSLLCSHRSIQRPLLLHCHTVVWGNNNGNSNSGGTAGKFFSPLARLCCVAAFEGNY